MLGFDKDQCYEFGVKSCGEMARGET